MVDAASAGGSREQTLLEAAKAMASLKGWTETFTEMHNLRAAIAREEAHPSTDARIDYEYRRATFWQLKASEANDRAQQAEADAKWHKAESERLSAELALARNQLTLAVERSERLSKQLSGCRYDLGEASKQRQRAEKAEAECSEQRARAESGEDRNRDLSEKLIAAHGKTHAESERAKKAESELAKERATSSRWLAALVAATGRKFNEPITQTIENLRQRAELAESMLAKPQQSHPMDGGDITATTQRVECLIGEWKQLKVEVSNLERTRDALLDVMKKKKQKAEAMDAAINLLAKVIGGDS